MSVRQCCVLLIGLGIFVCITAFVPARDYHWITLVFGLSGITAGLLLLRKNKQE